MLCVRFALFALLVLSPYVSVILMIICFVGNLLFSDSLPLSTLIIKVSIPIWCVLQFYLRYLCMFCNCFKKLQGWFVHHSIE